MPPGGQPRPTTVTLAAAVAALEGLGLACWGVFMVVEGLLADPDSRVRAEVGGLTVLALAVLPLLAARGLLRVSRWSRGPGTIVQLLALPVAFSMAQNGGAMIAAGLGVGLVGLVGLVALLHPATTSALAGER